MLVRKQIQGKYLETKKRVGNEMKGGENEKRAVRVKREGRQANAIRMNEEGDLLVRES